MGIGLIIKDLASQQNITLADLAKRLGKTKQAVYDIVEKEDVSTAIVRQCSKIFNVPASYFFEESGGGNAIANGHSVAAINSDIKVGNSLSQQEKIDYLERLLAEKERTIQILLERK